MMEFERGKPGDNGDRRPAVNGIYDDLTSRFCELRQGCHHLRGIDKMFCNHPQSNQVERSVATKVFDAGLMPLMDECIFIDRFIRIHPDEKSAAVGKDPREIDIVWKNIATTSDIKPLAIQRHELIDNGLVVLIGSKIIKPFANGGPPADPICLTVSHIKNLFEIDVSNDRRAAQNIGSHKSGF